MPDIIEIDYETRSPLKLRDVGAYKYFDSPYTQVMMASYQVNDSGEIKRWSIGDPCPADIKELFPAPSTIIFAHNAAFERLATCKVMSVRHGWPAPRLEQYRDTAAMAAAQSLPRKLEELAKALALPVQKDMDGNKLMQKLSKPRKIWTPEDRSHKRFPPPAVLRENPLQYTDTEDGRVIEWWADAQDIEREHFYCDRDVETQQAVRHALVDLPRSEWETYWLTERMNDAGVPISRELSSALQQQVEHAREELDQECRSLTGGQVTTLLQRDRIRNTLERDFGLSLPDLQAATLEKALNRSDISVQARRLIELRLEAGKASTAKLRKIDQAICSSGCIHGVHVYHGASTGRWSGRLLQTQNMPRGTGTVPDPVSAVPTMLVASPATIRMVYGPPIAAASDCLRAVITAPKGSELFAADFASIEGRVIAWLAGESWKIEAYELADVGKGPGLYEVAAGGIYGVDPASIGKKDKRRQVGKVADLALGFEGGVMALFEMAEAYHLDMAEAYESLQAAVDEGVWVKAEKSYCKKKLAYEEKYSELAPRHGKDKAKEAASKLAYGVDVLPREAWIASEVTKQQWRAKHPMVRKLWQGLVDAAIQATLFPGTSRSYGGVSYLVKLGFLWCRLPSKRCLAYGAPRVKTTKTPWGTDTYSLSGMTLDSKTGRWLRKSLYGGLLTENVVQAIARDLMAQGLKATEAAGYRNIMTVHDEGVALVPDGFGSLEEYCRLLASKPPWATGIPLRAEGYRSRHYKKD
ncbi:DNA polymerase [Polycladidibacter hongkongensis]|uniref:DNA polymerase n=1 Tax=Polycladidibacter hongkongensis TaxID=1647556 RepID=UPI00082DD520|nr:DNA polymerase [Pseudovibrio hongkongensis]